MSGPPAQTEPGSLTELTGVLLLSGAIFALAHYQAFTNPYIVNDDVRQQLFWMQQWLDPQLFPGDLLTRYARTYVPLGVTGLYWLASWGAGPIYFSKILTGALFVLLSGCFYRLGTTLAGRSLGWMTAGVSWLMPFFLDNLSGGLARAFAAPLLAWFWLSWLNRRPRGMGAALFLQALFIPYIFLVSATAVLLSFAAGKRGLGEPPPFPRRGSHFCILGVGAALVLVMNLRFTAAGFGPLVGAGEMANRPEFYAHGRFPILPVPSVFWELVSPWEFIAPVREWGPVAGGVVTALIVIAAVAGLRRVDWAALRPRLPSAGYLGLASLLLYLLARLLLLKLFVPDRYLIYTLNLFYCVALALGFHALLWRRPWPRNLAVAALVVLAGVSAWRLHGVGLKDYSAYRPLYAALARTPKDALVAGHPNLMDNIPTFARRRALATYELAHVWARGYWRELQPRLADFFQAYYAADPQEVVAFCRKYGISFLVVDDRHFTSAFLAGGYFLFPYDKPQAPGAARGLAERNYCPFFAPFDEQIRQLTADRKRFALLSGANFPTLKVNEHLRLLDMRSLLALPDPQNQPKPRSE